MAGILVDDRIERAANQETPRVLGQLMGDPDHLARVARGLKRVGDTTVSGARRLMPSAIRRFGRTQIILAPPLILGISRVIVRTV